MTADLSSSENHSWWRKHINVACVPIPTKSSSSNITSSRQWVVLFIATSTHGAQPRFKVFDFLKSYTSLCKTLFRSLYIAVYKWCKAETTNLSNTSAKKMHWSTTVNRWRGWTQPGRLLRICAEPSITTKTTTTIYFNDTKYGHGLENWGFHNRRKTSSQK